MSQITIDPVEEMRRKREHWRRNGILFGWAHPLIGLSAAALAAMTAVSVGSKVKSRKEPSRRDAIFAGYSAALSFLSTSLNANQRSDHYATGARILENALFRYDAKKITLDELEDAFEDANLATEWNRPSDPSPRRQNVKKQNSN